MATLKNSMFCRFCLSNANESIDFLTDDQDVYQKMVLDTFNIQVCQLKAAEKKICVKCAVGIRAAVDLKRVINAAQTKLSQHRDTSANESLDVNAPIKEEINIDIDEIKFEFDAYYDDDENGDPLHVEAKNLNITTESSDETVIESAEMSQENINKPQGSQVEIELTNGAQTASGSPLPCKSKEKYMLAYENFLLWKSSKNAKSFTENVFVAYFKELAMKYKPSTLWCIYSMLKTTVRAKNGVDIKTHSKLTAYLKRRSDGFSSSKTKVLTANEVVKFITEAPDHQYLATKVALIFGITGGCRRQELNNITTKDIQSHGSKLLVNIASTESNTSRSFTIHSPFCEIVKKYENLRSKKAKTDRFFQNYQKGKCTSQPIGVNKFGAMPKEIARFLRLPDADSYTGHSFRRTSATLLADSKAYFLTDIMNPT